MERKWIIVSCPWVCEMFSMRYKTQEKGTKVRLQAGHLFYSPKTLGHKDVQVNRCVGRRISQEYGVMT